MQEASPQQQLNLNFATENPLAERLSGGQFCILVEIDSPPQEQPLESALAPARSMVKALGKHDLAAGVAVTDRLAADESHDPVEVAGALLEVSGHPVVMHLSGKGSSTDRVRDLLARAASAGVRNLLAVTGDRSDQHPAANAFGHIPKHPVGYRDSVATILTARQSGQRFQVGAGVNPYKYNPPDQYLQFYKMMRKLAAGADFLVTHVGWDMKKLQEIQWFLQMREVPVPVIARLALLWPDEINNLADGLYPGVPISRPFAAMLQRESDVNATQSLAAQLQRLGLQVAGCRLLGYSGVQLAGLRDERTMEMVLKRVGESLTAITSYQDWVAAWHDYHSGMDFAPVPGAYYAFKDLLGPSQQYYDAEVCQMTDRDLPLPSWRDRVQSQVRRLAFFQATPAVIRKAMGRVLLGTDPESSQGLAHVLYLNPSGCPKQLVYGACGGSQVDGTCEFGHVPCFHHRVLALAARRHQVDRLEEAVE